MFDAESTPAPLGASDAPILTENDYREVEYVPPPSGSDEDVGSDDGVAARTVTWCASGPRRVRVKTSSLLLYKLNSLKQ